MANKRKKINDPELAKVGVALERAAARARQIGFDTNTPVYVYRDGKIIDIVAEHRAKRSPQATKSKNSRRKTTSSRRKA